MFRILQQLPEELLQDVLERLRREDLRRLQAASRWAYRVATPLLWREVMLMDCRTQYEDGNDEHDDTPLIKVLILLARRPDLAACVHTITHQCHLPPPAIFHELPRMPFCSQTLSTDPRTTQLVRRAVRNMTIVSTLRIVFGHPNLTDALLRCFFDKHRSKSTPVRRLWLENCRISAGCNLSLDYDSHGLPLELDFDGLQSIRVRRLPLRPGQPWSDEFDPRHVVHARGSLTRAVAELQDGMGGIYETDLNTMQGEMQADQGHLSWLAAQKNASSTTDVAIDGQQKEAPGIVSPLSQLCMFANLYDHRLYNALGTCLTSEETALLAFDLPPNTTRSEFAYRGAWLDPLDLKTHDASLEWKRWQREKIPSADAAIHLFRSASRTLTSLTLDWLFTSPLDMAMREGPSAQRLWMDTFLGLFSLRFPHLRAFQYRNAVVQDTEIPCGLYLLDYITLPSSGDGRTSESSLNGIYTARHESLSTAGLEFMEAHANLQCLAWPMDRFFSKQASSLASRVETVVSNLGRTLLDLRVDSLYSGNGESQSHSNGYTHPKRRDERRRFIESFAAKMRKLQSIKVEGGVPRDERRELIRALHACPLEKVVMIGVCCPAGNTWGAEGSDLPEPLEDDEASLLEGEDKEAVWKYGPMRPESPGAEFKFEAEYGWPPSPPMLNTIAPFHAETVTELKFCGYKGSPVLLTPTPITTPMLSALKHFHNLQSLITSMWLYTNFEGARRDMEIISYWRNARSPTSTALVRVTDEEPEGWEKELRTKYAPDALAWRVTSFLGPFLSEKAKARKGGVHVRASFCIGDWGGIFDVDLDIGKGSCNSDVCLGYSGPREELEGDRRRTKLDNRRWF